MIILALLAGLINAVAIYCHNGMTVSHVTGLISKFSVSVSVGDFVGCLGLAAVILAFFAGAVVAGVATGERAFHLDAVYGCIIISIGLLILLPLVLDATHTVILLAFLMGLQNGMVVSFRGILVRSTHMTGNITDLGVYLGYKIRGDRNEKPIYGIVPALTIAGFILGGIIGIMLYEFIGSYIFVAASAVYIILGTVYFYLQKTCVDKNFNGVPDSLEPQE